MLRGFLPDSCYDAAVTARPRMLGATAQIHIVLTKDEGSSFCTIVLTEWTRTIRLEDSTSQNVEVLVNGIVVMTIPVEETLSVLYKVFSRDIDLSDIPGGPHRPIRVCSIAPAGRFPGFQFNERFGPATYQECQDWITANCNQ